MYNEMLRITEVVSEGKDVTTLRFNLDIRSKPGQFLMIWIPDVDEIPMGISYLQGGITVKKIGDATSALSSLKPGDLIGVRGPYGNGWDIPSGKKVLCVGGGVGASPILAAAEYVNNPDLVDIILAAKTADEVIFLDRAKKHSNHIEIATDDGSMGTKGTAVDLAVRMMNETKYDLVLGCGPEIMNKFLLKACDENNIPVQLSLERIMKCGTGLCGCCVINGQRVCADGPVFTGEQIKKMSEFGSSKRDHSGRNIKF